MSDLIRQMAGISPPPRKQQTQFLRPQGSPVHYTDGTVMPEADSNMYEAFQNAYERMPSMGAQIQPPDMAAPVQPVQPNPYANKPVKPPLQLPFGFGMR